MIRFPFLYYFLCLLYFCAEIFLYLYNVAICKDLFYNSISSNTGCKFICDFIDLRLPWCKNCGENHKCCIIFKSSNPQRFGTFMCNNEKQRNEEAPSTISLWSHLNNIKEVFRNENYVPDDEVLYMSKCVVYNRWIYMIIFIQPCSQ